MERYPRLVHNFVYSNKSIYDLSKDDLVASLLLWLVDKRTVEKYDESKRKQTHGGDTGKEKLFLNFMYFCLRRAQQTIMARWKSDALWWKSEHIAEQDIHPALYAMAAAPTDTAGKASLDAFAKKLKTTAPGFSRMFELLRMGYSITELSQASGLDRGVLDNIVRAVFPAIMNNRWRWGTSNAYRTLMALGDFTPDLKARSNAHVQEPPVQLNCVVCGKEFQVEASVHRYRLKASKDGKLSCSHKCGAARKKASIKRHGN